MFESMEEKIEALSEKVSGFDSRINNVAHVAANHWHEYDDDGGLSTSTKTTTGPHYN
jgi:hypothetical protein